jgi:hypothetical protein
MIVIDEEDKRFFIADSSIPNGGKGLFAKVLIPKGSNLEIIGAMVRKGSVADECTDYAKRYKFLGGKEDAYIVPFGYGGIVNHTDDREKQNVEIRYLPGYSKKSQHSSNVVYFFLKDVLPGEEVLGFYGKAWAEEIEKISSSLDHIKSNKDEWERFLEFDLYRLSEIDKILRG